MDDLISRQAAIDAINKAFDRETLLNSLVRKIAVDAVKVLPTADVVPVKRGKWTEKHHAYLDEENPIEEWQSCKCSECGRYDTRPYLYYFREPRFCSWCGARMDGDPDA